MKTAVKVMIIIGAVLIAVGLTLAGVAFLSGKISTGGISDMPYETKTYDFKASSIEKIKIESEFADIIFEKAHQNDKINISVSENEKYKYTISFEDGFLSVKPTYAVNWRNIFNFSFNTSHKMIISVPETLYEDVESVEASSSSGDITFVSGLDIGGNVLIGTASGKTYITNCNIDGDISIGSSSGDVEITGSEISGNVSFGGASSEAEISDTKITGKLNVGTSSGSVDIKRTSCGDFEFGSASGEIELDDVDMGNVKANTASGSLEFNKLKAKNINLESTSGKIKGTLYGRNEYIIGAKSVSGRIDVPESALGSTKRLNAETTSGSIRISFCD